MACLFLNWAAEPSDAPGRPAVKPGIRGAADCLATEDNSPHNAEPPMGPDQSVWERSAASPKT